MIALKRFKNLELLLKMCLIISSQPIEVAGKPCVSLETIKSAIAANPHGVGVAWADGRVHVKRRVRANAETVHKLITSLHEAGFAWTFHTRFATHGKVNEANTHPVQLSDEVVLSHNGILSGYGSTEVSDTREFCRVHLRGIRADAVHDPETIERLERMGVMRGSKFAILSHDGRISHVNKDAGYKCDLTGCWFSAYGYAYGQEYDAFDYGWNHSPSTPMSSRTNTSCATRRLVIKHYKAEDILSAADWARIKSGEITLDLACEWAADDYLLDYDPLTGLFVDRYWYWDNMSATGTTINRYLEDKASESLGVEQERHTDSLPPLEDGYILVAANSPLVPIPLEWKFTGPAFTRWYASTASGGMTCKQLYEASGARYAMPCQSASELVKSS